MMHISFLTISVHFIVLLSLLAYLSSLRHVIDSTNVSNGIAAPFPRLQIVCFSPAERTSQSLLRLNIDPELT